MADKVKLTNHEIEVLEMLVGKREGQWGAWVSACLESLEGRGLVTHGPYYTATEEGRKALGLSLIGGGE